MTIFFTSIIISPPKLIIAQEEKGEKQMDKEKVIIEKLDDIKESIDLLLKLVGSIHESQMFSLLSPLERSLQSEEFQNLLSECEQTLSDS